MFCKEEEKVHWFLAAGGQIRPVQTRNYSISLHRRQHTTTIKFKEMKKAFAKQANQQKNYIPILEHNFIELS